MPQQLSWQEKKRRIEAWYGYVYLLKCGNHYKIGQSKKPRTRLKQLRTGSPHPIEVVHTLRTPHFRQVEQMLHRRFASKRGEGEWFLLSEEDVGHIKSLDDIGRTPEEARKREEEDEDWYAKIEAEQQAEADRRLAVYSSGVISGVGLCLAID